MPDTTDARPTVSTAGFSLKGRRPSNEDAALWSVFPEGTAVRAYALVCDGMGGHNAGEVASAMASEGLASRIAAAVSESRSPEELETALHAWITDVNETVYDRSLESLQHRGMGTTVAVAMVTPSGRLVVANIGDSKIFLVRGQEVVQISIDHTALAERRRALGPDEALSAEEEAHSPFAHALTRSLGQEPEANPDSRSDIQLEPGDVVVVTSDGVTDVLAPEGLVLALECSTTLQQTAEHVYRLSFEGGSRDNISVSLLAYGAPTRLGVGGNLPTVTLPAARDSRRGGRISALLVALGVVAALSFFLQRRRRTTESAAMPPPAGVAVPATVDTPGVTAGTAGAEAPPPAETITPAPDQDSTAASAATPGTVSTSSPVSPAPRRGVPLPTTQPLPPSSIPSPTPPPPTATEVRGIPVSEAVLKDASVTLDGNHYRFDFVFADDIRPPRNAAASSSFIRVATRGNAPLSAAESYSLTCSAKESTLTCLLPAKADDARLAAGDLLRVKLTLDGKPLEAPAEFR